MIGNNYLDFLIEHKLSPSLFTIMWCIYNEEEDKLTQLYALPTLEKLKCNLVYRKWLDSDNYPTEEFTKLFLKDIEEAANEIWDIWYPGIKLNINGNQFSAKGIGYDEFVLVYRKITKGIVKRHLEIKNITKNYVQRYIKPKMQLKKYIETRFFDDIASEFSKENNGNDPLIKTI